MIESKNLSKSDESGFLFAKEMLDDNPTAGINFDRIQKHPEHGYIIFEYLLCEEEQEHVTPYTSHPKYYWNKNSRKFISLWELTKALNATLYLVNYAKPNTEHEDKIKLFYDISNIDDNLDEKLEAKTENMNKSEFKKFFRTLNSECLGKKPCKECGSPLVKRKGNYGEFLGCSDYPKTKCSYKEKI